MNIAILDDYLDVVPSLASCAEFTKSTRHRVTVWNDHTKEVGALAERLRDTDALILLRERTPVTAALLERLPRKGSR